MKRISVIWKHQSGGQKRFDIFSTAFQLYLTGPIRPYDPIDSFVKNLYILSVGVRLTNSGKNRANFVLRERESINISNITAIKYKEHTHILIGVMGMGRMGLKRHRSMSRLSVLGLRLRAAADRWRAVGATV